MSDTYRVLRALANMAWERAKGEMMSIDHVTYSGVFDKEHYKRFEELRDEFIEKVENETALA